MKELLGKICAIHWLPWSSHRHPAGGDWYDNGLVTVLAIDGDFLKLQADHHYTAARWVNRNLIAALTPLETPAKPKRWTEPTGWIGSWM